MTNGDKIRAMTDEELADFFCFPMLLKRCRLFDVSDL